MKRGKDDEKIMGPMFPRLHVNDTEKGGPRAPPRNKMALYEQLSIPSQRFSSGMLPLNPNNSSNLVPPASSNQGSGSGRNMYFPLHLPPSTPTHLSERLNAGKAGGASPANPLARVEMRKNAGDGDDFMVPVYVQSGTGQGKKNGNAGDNAPNYIVKIQSFCNDDPKRSSSVGLTSRQESNLDASIRSYRNVVSAENGHRSLKEADAPQNPVLASFSMSRGTDAQLQQGNGDGSQSEEHVQDFESDETSRDIEKGVSSWQSHDTHLGETQRCLPEPNSFDSASGLDISPDDVVGIIGQKHFWKARRAIVNQQRVFAVQVFELHRLIKVQKLIAGSPHLLIEDASGLGKTSLVNSLGKKFCEDRNGRYPSQTKSHKDELEKPGHQMECSAENAVGKTSISSVKSANQLSDYGPGMKNPPLAPLVPDMKMGPWGYPQSAGQQWLIPVMSPSEGLVYKPYPMPGFTGPACGGCGPCNSSPLMANIPNPAYGVPLHHNHQGFGFPLGVPPPGHSYFPTYGMPVMSFNASGSSVEQTKQFSGPVKHGQTGQLSGGEINNLQRQNSSNIPKQRKGSVAHIKFQANKDSELQVSTASSPSEKPPEGLGNVQSSDGKEALPLFPVAPVVSEGGSQLREADQPTRVIRSVPHNARSATESVARIFRSIQEERKQLDSI
ncbi:hypothetical protein BT93_F0677 [Corymbia citriodora subsp. variegata]|nr:hypothetical protein BT93_F0677 [Corymbia citriodora subsp. variegata]KAF8023246.1 hypothetical protein BT93_F0677 [Corymbia citriodora subsp. variegata]